MTQVQEGNADTLQSLEAKLLKAQRAIATLQAQHVADKQTIESMANDIAEILDIQDSMGHRLQRLDECEQSIRVSVDATRELIMELAPDGAPERALVSSDLAQELSAAECTSVEDVTASGKTPSTLSPNVHSHASTDFLSADSADAMPQDATRTSTRTAQIQREQFAVLPGFYRAIWITELHTFLDRVSARSRLILVRPCFIRCLQHPHSCTGRRQGDRVLGKR